MKKLSIVLLGLLLLVILVPWSYADQVNLKILYVNDFHGFGEPYKATANDAPLGASPTWQGPWTGLATTNRLYCWPGGI